MHTDVVDHPQPGHPGIRTPPSEWIASGTMLRLDEDYVTDGATAHQPLRLATGRRVPGLEIDAQPNAGLLACINHASRVIRRCGQRLVTEDVLAGSGGGYRVVRVHRIRARDEYDVHLSVVEEVGVLRICMGRAVAFGEVGGSAVITADDTHELRTVDRRNCRRHQEIGMPAGSNDTPAETHLSHLPRRSWRP